MSVRTLLFGQPIRSEAEPEQRIPTAEGIPVLGLDAFASASYGPEAALTVLAIAGASASRAIVPVIAAIVGLLLIVYFSYRQTLAAYPNGGGSFTVAKENLGATPGLVAAAALAIDYILNAAVAISAGVGALVSAMPALLPYTLWLCLGILALLTIVNLRGVRTTGLLFMLPAFTFVGMLAIVIGIGLLKLATSHGAPTPAVPLPEPRVAAASAIGWWLLLRAFASGCTAMTGVEAVSNAVPLFREPPVTHARRTLTAIVATLVLLLAGIAVLARAYGITATAPGEPGYQSVVSLVVAAVVGRGAVYYVTMAAVLSVLALSANTSFADFPRVCRMLAADRYLPAELARRGSRLVFSNGLVVLATLVAILLIVFGGITDHLIPLFAVGALLAFTMSQLGMVAHWRRCGGPHAKAKLLVNGVGAAATTAALGVVVVSKFTHGAWMVTLVIPALVLLFRRTKRFQARLSDATRAEGPLDVSGLRSPIVVIPLRRLDQVGRKALRFALTVSRDVDVVQVLAEELDTDDLEAKWRQQVEEPIRSSGLPSIPRLVILRSPYREFFDRFLTWVRDRAGDSADREVIVLIPELVHRRWYQFIVNHRAFRLRARLLLQGTPNLSVMSTPWYREPRG